jgi:hypothetical protein
MNKSRKLINFFIYPQFQLKLIGMIMAISLMAPLTIFSFQTYSFKQQIKNGQMLNLPESHPYFVFYNEFQDKTIFVFFLSLAISFILAIAVGLIVSHRIAGPLVKLKKHLQKVAEDQEKDHPIYFREGDFFRDIAETYNLRFQNKK